MIVDKAEIMRRLEHLVKVAGSQKRLAATMGISPSFLSDVLLNRREPTGAILEWLDFEEVTMYRSRSGKHRS